LGLKQPPFPLNFFFINFDFDFDFGFNLKGVCVMREIAECFTSE
jgi:hypothetical protein